MNLFLKFILFLSITFYNAVFSLLLSFVPRRFRRKKDITGQKVLITGAGSGVGRQLAVEFAKHSTCLILVDINRKSLLQTEKLLEGRSAVFIYECDVSDYEKVYEMSRKVKKDVGDVDILVNNAGIVCGKDLLDLPEEKIVKTMGVNALAHIWMCKAFLPAMMKRNRGHVVSVASIAGKVGSPRLTDYCASKFAAVGFAEALELELCDKDLDGIKVTLVCPAHIDTGLFKGAKFNIGTILTAEHVAREIVYGVLEDQETIFIPPIMKVIIHMKNLVPRWIIIKVSKITGDIKVMENFTGREVNGEDSVSRNGVESNVKPIKTD